ncbi:MAG TPA: TonB-dependent receptor [Flavitalea sp.]|nr:TonB-dependent receptor [Flavitalea sp.]
MKLRRPGPDRPDRNGLCQLLRVTRLSAIIFLTASIPATAHTYFPAYDYQQQAAPIKGVVVSATGEPVAAVSVTVKGSSTGTSTDVTGNFSLNAPAGATLVFSSVGFVEQEFKTTGPGPVKITLQPSNNTMDEVVVIGYGVANKRDLTGSIVKIEGKQVADKPNTNPVTSLAGKVSGLSVIPNATPGKAPDIRIRGTVSIGAVTPLYVVDGILQDNIDYINPNDIESIEVLKDPSSLAIFGVRGATGVIAITTKRAKAGQTVVNFNTTYGYKELVDKIKMVDAAGFEKLFTQERLNNGVTDAFDYTGLTANTNWIDEVTRKAQFSASNLSVSSSTQKNKFNFGLGYTLDEGIIKHEKLQRFLLSVNDEVKLNDAFKMGFNLNVSRQNNPYTLNSDADHILDDARKPIPQISSGTKNFFVRDPYGSEFDSMNVDVYSRLEEGLQGSGVVNPLFKVENEWDKTKNIEYRTVGSVFAEVNFLKHFNFRSSVYADMSNINKRQYFPLYYGYNPRNEVASLYTQTTKVIEDDETYRKFQQDHVLNYKNDFGDHALTLTGGFTTYYFGYTKRTGVASQAGDNPIPNDERFWYVTSGFEDQANTSATSSQRENTTVSYLARALYNYRGKYFLNASFRNDASSRIPKINRNQQFYAIGAAWEITKEGFMDQQHLFDFLKLKASYGKLGNQSAYKSTDNTPLDYPSFPTLVTGNTAAAVFGTNVFNVADAEYIANPDLKWETVTAYEGGVEFAAFGNRLNGEVNYFVKETNDLMTYISRASLGLKDKLVNGGSIRNQGVEVSLNWNQQFSKDWSFNLGGNITFLKNKVLTLSDEIPTGLLIRANQNNGAAESRTAAGHPIASFFGYVVDGIYQDQADIDNSPVVENIQGGDPRPGDFKFKDINGDKIVNAKDRTYIGNPTPDFTYGASAMLSYKMLSLSIDITGVSGNEIFRTWGSLESPFQRVNYAADKLGAWSGPGTSNTIPLISQGDRINYNGSTYNIESGTYLRIRNIQLSYGLPTAMLSRAKIKGLRVFVNVQNLKTFKNNLGYAPEFTGDATSFGYDFAGGAIPVVSTAGINVTF